MPEIFNGRSTNCPCNHSIFAGQLGYCPFVVSLYDAYKRDSSLHLVLEYMDGGSLQDLVDRGGSCDEQLLAKIAYNVLRVSATMKQAS